VIGSPKQRGNLSGVISVAPKLLWWNHMVLASTVACTYNTSNTLLKQLGRDAGYDIPIDHYALRRWTANEANREPPI
jgi:hypothetical protein